MERISKLIYDLADQGGEMLSLRYDLTVCFTVTMIFLLSLYCISKLILGAICSISGYEQDQADETLPHCSGVSARPTCHDKRTLQRVLSMCE